MREIYDIPFRGRPALNGALQMGVFCAVIWGAIFSVLIVIWG